MDTRRFGVLDNIWQQYGDTNQAYSNVSYTPGIDLTLSPGNELTQFQLPPEAHGQGPVVEEKHTFSSSSQQPQPASEQKKKGVAKREKNYSNLEDEILCSAYLNVSKDPVVGVNQPMKSYWQRITDYFNDMKKTGIERSSSSLQHRWGDISRDTSFFCSYYAEIERRNQSGKSEDDKIKDALQMYEELRKRKFKFLHCWFILRKEQKWSEFLATTTSSKSQPVSDADPVHQGDQTAAASPQVNMPEKIARPIGRDRAKKQRTSSSSSSSSACFEMLQKIQLDRSRFEEEMKAASKSESQEMAARYDRKLALQEEHLKLMAESMNIQKEMLKLQQKEREDRVMHVDLDKVVPWVREYYINEQKKIAAKSRAEASSCDV